MTIISLVLLIVAGAMWVRSTRREDRISFAAGHRRYWLVSADHRVWVKVFLSLSNCPEVEGHSHDDVEHTAWAWLWPEWRRDLFRGHLAMPYWMLMAPATILPAKWMMKRRRRRRRM